MSSGKHAASFFQIRPPPRERCIHRLVVCRDFVSFPTCLRLFLSFPGLYHQGVLERWQHGGHLQTLQQVLRPAGERVSRPPSLRRRTFPPAMTSIIQQAKRQSPPFRTVFLRRCLGEPGSLSLSLSLLRPSDIGNYIVREETENVPIDLMEGSDVCGDRADDHRNV